MPRLGSTVTDDKGLNLIQRWIDSLKGAGESPAISPQTAKDESDQDATLTALEQQNSPDNAIIAIDKLIASTEGALKLLNAVEDGRVQPGYRPIIASRAMLPTIPDTVRDLFSRFGPLNTSPKLGANPDVDKLLAMTGDIERGRKVFFEVGGGLCSKCHIVADKGLDFGPNLSQIGMKYNRTDMLDNILHPSKTIAQGYETYVVRTKSNQSFMGFLVSKSDTEIVLKDAERKLVTIKADDIDKMATQPISAMPEGIIAELEAQQAADLLEYLVTRK